MAGWPRQGAGPARDPAGTLAMTRSRPASGAHRGLALRRELPAPSLARLGVFRATQQWMGRGMKLGCWSNAGSHGRKIFQAFSE
jgi:hypothetical protein